MRLSLLQTGASSATPMLYPRGDLCRSAWLGEHGRRDGRTHMADMGYEAARTELAETVARLEAGGLTLEESLALWQRGEELAAICTAWLQGAREKFEGD